MLRKITSRFALPLFPRYPLIRWMTSRSNTEIKYLSLVYRTSEFDTISKYLEQKHSLNCYNFVTNVIDSAIYAYELDNTPCLELFIHETGFDGDLHVTAVDERGENIIKQLFKEHSNILEQRQCIVKEPLSYDKS